MILFSAFARLSLKPLLPEGSDPRGVYAVGGFGAPGALGVPGAPGAPGALGLPAPSGLLTTGVDGLKHMGKPPYEMKAAYPSRFPYSKL